MERLWGLVEGWWKVMEQRRKSAECGENLVEGWWNVGGTLVERRWNSVERRWNAGGIKWN